MRISRNMIKKMLPKEYLRAYVADQMYVAITCFRNLFPVLDQYVYCDGTRKNLMSLTGTIPVEISGTTYNIPLCLWIEQKYPQSAPICYVKPTQEMMVVPGKYVTHNGEVRLPYLEDWRSGDCDLVSLLQVMVAMFGECPPLCMQPEFGQSSCWQQYRQDEGYCLLLAKDDGHPFQNENETNC